MNRKMLANEISYTRKNKYYSVTGQWQGRCERLTVIGDGSLAANLKVLMKKSYRGKRGECMGLKALRENSNVALKFILFIHNPYDLIASKVIRLSKGKKQQKEIFDTMMHRFIVCCERHNAIEQYEFLSGYR